MALPSLGLHKLVTTQPRGGAGPWHPLGRENRSIVCCPSSPSWAVPSFTPDTPPNTPGTPRHLHRLTAAETPIRGFGAVAPSVIPGRCGCFFQNKGSVFYPLGPSRPTHLSSDWFDVAWETQPAISPAWCNLVTLPVAQPWVSQPGGHGGRADSYPFVCSKTGNQLWPREVLATFRLP